MRFILIANNNEIDDDMINKINIQHNDIIILFNHHFPIKFQKIKKHPNKILLMRYLTGDKKLLGLDQYYNNYQDFKLVLSYYKADETIDYLRDEFYNSFEKVKGRKLLINDFIHHVSNSKNYILNKKFQTFSTGFVGYLFAKFFSRPHLRELFNFDIALNKIILVGFTGTYPKTQFNPHHDFDKEQEYYEIDKKNNLLDFINPEINARNIKKNIVNIVNSFLVDPSLEDFIYPITKEIKPIIDFKNKNNEKIIEKNNEDINNTNNIVKLNKPKNLIINKKIKNKII